MSFGTTVEWLGGISIGNWYVAERLRISHFTTSASITEYWQGMMSVLIFFLLLIRLRIYWWPHHYEFWNYRGVAWWYEHWQLVCGQFGLSQLFTSASNTEYWLGMMSVLIFFLILIRTRIYWCPHHYEFRNYRGEVWWYEHWQLVCGQFGYVTLHYKCFHHWVLAGNGVSFDILPDFDPYKNILVSTPLWV